jgi:hypothetical protein
MLKKVLPLLLITLVFSGCSWFQQPQNTTDKIVYENSDLNFSVELPSSAKGYVADVDNDPIPPEATQTIDFFLKSDGFLSLEVFSLETWADFSKDGYDKNEIGRSDSYVFTARQSGGGKYVLSDSEFEAVKKSFKLLK